MVALIAVMIADYWGSSKDAATNSGAAGRAGPKRGDYPGYRLLSRRMAKQLVSRRSPEGANL